MYVYIVKCSDESLYTGITDDLKRRVNEHNNKRGAKSLKGKLPVILVYQEEYKTKSEALKREYEIKTWKREKKLELIRSGSSMVEQKPFKLWVQGSSPCRITKLSSIFSKFKFSYHFPGLTSTFCFE